MNNVSNFKSFKSKKNLERAINSLKDVLAATRSYHESLRPHIRYRVVFNKARDLVEYRERLLREIKDCEKRLKELE